MRREPWNYLDRWNVIFVVSTLLALWALRGRLL